MTAPPSATSGVYGDSSPVEELRREPSADDRADDDPGERERPGDEPSPQPVQRREHDHARARSSRSSASEAALEEHAVVHPAETLPDLVWSVAGVVREGLHELQVTAFDVELP